MRDQYRSKQELCDELAGLRKQIADLKAEMVTRRRVEDPVRGPEELPHVLAIAQEEEHRMVCVRFRRKDGTTHALRVIGTRCHDGGRVALAVLEPAG